MVSDLSGSGVVAFRLKDSVPWLGTVRGRAGLAVDNVLLYLTAGLAYGRTNHVVSDMTNPPPSGFPEVFHDFSTTKIGPVAGAGIEYGLDPRWSVKAEALYVDLGKHTGIFQNNRDPNLQPGFSGRLETLDTMWIVRAGVNYKFGG
jgi:outer membrane immunogenic protein